MKAIKFFIFLSITILLGSCSSNDNDSASSTEYFNYKIDGQTVNVTQWEAVKSENDIEVSGLGTDGNRIIFAFNSKGSIGEVSTYSNSDNSIPSRNAQRYYTNESFNFNLVSINTNNKTLEVTFSGKVYEDNYNLNSNFVNVEGGFLVKYTDVIPEVSGLDVFAKVAGNDWYSSIGDQEGGFFSGNNITLNSYNGDVYSINITTNHDNTNVGNFNFSPTTTNNKVTLSKYNTLLNYFEKYDCTGSLNLTSKIIGQQFTIISGTFSFTALDPITNTQISVTNGAFKEVYINY